VALHDLTGNIELTNGQNDATGMRWRFVRNILATLEAGLIDFYFRVNGLVDTRGLTPEGIYVTIQDSGSFVQ
jgi:hypothetical protein